MTPRRLLSRLMVTTMALGCGHGSLTAVPIKMATSREPSTITSFDETAGYRGSYRLTTNRSLQSLPLKIQQQQDRQAVYQQALTDEINVFKLATQGKLKTTGVQPDDRGDYPAREICEKKLELKVLALSKSAPNVVALVDLAKETEALAASLRDNIATYLTPLLFQSLGVYDDEVPTGDEYLEIAYMMERLESALYDSIERGSQGWIHPSPSGVIEEFYDTVTASTVVANSPDLLEHMQKSALDAAFGISVGAQARHLAARLYQLRENLLHVHEATGVVAIVKQSQQAEQTASQKQVAAAEAKVLDGCEASLSLARSVQQALESYNSMAREVTKTEKDSVDGALQEAVYYDQSGLGICEDVVEFDKRSTSPYPLIIGVEINNAESTPVGLLREAILDVTIPIDTWRRMVGDYRDALNQHRSYRGALGKLEFPLLLYPRLPADEAVVLAPKSRSSVDFFAPDASVALSNIVMTCFMPELGKACRPMDLCRRAGHRDLCDPGRAMDYFLKYDELDLNQDLCDTLDVSVTLRTTSNRRISGRSIPARIMSFSVEVPAGAGPEVGGTQP
jgi:hypothetical protein